MTLDQLNAQHAKEQEPPPEIVVEEEGAYDPEATLNEAYDLLQEAMEVFGNNSLRRKLITYRDKLEMGGIAERIRQFLIDLGELEGEEDEDGFTE